MSYKLSSNFKPYIEGLIEQKQAVGYPYDTSSRILKDFDRFCSKHYPTATVLTAEIIDAMGCQKNGRACELPVSAHNAGPTVGKIYEQHRGRGICNTAKDPPKANTLCSPHIYTT